MTIRPGKRKAFTLVELLVVIAIIGILVGMLLPAVQQVREAARRASCLNNLKQLTLACQNYESSNMAFPNGVGNLNLSSGAMSTEGSSWVVRILPFVDLVNLQSELMAVMGSQDSNDGMLAACAHASATVVLPTSNFFCPSSTQADQMANDPERSGSTVHYVGCAGPNSETTGATYDLYAPTGYPSIDRIGANGLFAPSFHPSTGLVFYARQKAKTYADIKDGSSNTIAIGELAASDTDSFTAHRVGWAFGGSGINLSIAGQPRYIPQELFAVKCVGVDGLNTNRNYFADKEFRNGHCFHSNHPGGTQFSFADGSARFVNEGVDAVVLRQLSSIDGRETISTSDL